MTKEQAIAILSNEKRLCKPYVKKKMGEDLVYEALDMAIKALEQQPISCNATTEEIAQSFINDVEAVKDYLPKCNSMEFPKDFYEFVDDYGFIDDKQIYTNGSHLIPVFRVEQWLNHIERPTTQEILSHIETGITATGQSDSYCVGFCNALIWLKSCITHEEPQFFEDSKVSEITTGSTTADDCVSRAEVNKLYDEYRPRLATHVSEFGDKLKALPPVTPAQCIAAVRFSKEDLREICNERIEIACEHGTCKDCFYYNIDEDGHGYHCEKYGHTRFPVYADFYCKDFTHKE